MGGAEGGEPLRLLFVGRPEWAPQFELYFRAGPERGVSPVDVLFRGSLASYALHRRDLARRAGEVDIVACEGFPGALAHDDDILHFPALAGHLRVAETIEKQIRRMRSRGQRDLARHVLHRERYRDWIETGSGALESFYATLHAPYVRARFGAWGKVEDPQVARRLYARGGRLLFVAERARPTEPVCGALLYPGPSGSLAYHINGFATDDCSTAQRAERTTALELALLRHAIVHRFASIDLGYTRGILNDGLFVHKRRLGASFAPIKHSPRFRVYVRPGRRAAVFARFPLLAGSPDAWTAVLGYHPSLPRMSKQAWRSTLKAYRIASLSRVVIWTERSAADAPDRLALDVFREAVEEALEVPEGVICLTDE